MKKIISIILGLTLLNSCIDSILDKAPLDIISDNVVWGDQILIDAYLTDIYASMSILVNESPNSNSTSSENWNGPFIVNEITDECKRNWVYGQGNSYKTNGIRISGGFLEWWENAYIAIRALNEFIEKMPEAPVSVEFRTNRIAEARFLRAYNYFSMVRRYGGVPLITRAQSIDETNEELFLPRDSEQAVYDFIISEMDEIANDLPENNTSEDYGRPTKYAALTLKSRAALYAGSIARFGEVQLSGLLGMEATQATSYYQKAYDAAQVIMSQSSHALYQADDDKVQNFKNIFLVKNNPEAIWVRKHTYTDRISGGNGWVWDFFQCPKPQGWNAGNQNAPYLEMVEEFEYIDGTPGTLDRTAIQTGLWETEDLWKDKDPRFFATIYTMNTAWKGSYVDWHNGLLLPDGTLQIDGSYEGVAARGTQSVDESFGTGFGVMKYLEESKDNMGERATSGTDWQIFRFAEVLLNYAEAAFELGRTDDALNAINQLRARAGIATLQSIDREKIRHERKVELAFEGHRYWDLRRWRIAEQELTVNRSGLRYILDYTTRKFQLQVISEIDGRAPVFFTHNIYFPITLRRTGNNPSLVENPGYN